MADHGLVDSAVVDELLAAAVEAGDWMSRCGPFLEAVCLMAKAGSRAPALGMIADGGRIQKRLQAAIKETAGL